MQPTSTEAVHSSSGTHTYIHRLPSLVRTQCIGERMPSTTFRVMVRVRVLIRVRVRVRVRVGWGGFSPHMHTYGCQAYGLMRVG